MSSISISARKKQKKRKTKLNSPAEIERAANLLSGRKPTPFSLEGWLVETVRRNRCLNGWSFTKADESARDLANAALKKIGWSIRPTPQDGQPFLMSDPSCCAKCGEQFVTIFGPGSDRIMGHRLKFCSFECLHESYRDKLNSQDFKVKNRAKVAAHREKVKAEAEPKACLHCAEMFQPVPGQIYCSQDCSRAAHASDRKAPPRECEVCGNQFQSTQYGEQAAKQRYCSRECWHVAHPGNPPRPCDHCGEIYKPVRGPQGAKSKFCSRRCVLAAKSKKHDFVPEFACEPVE